MFLSLPPYFKAFLPLVIISTICLFMILSYQKTYSHQKEEIFVNTNNVLTSIAMDSSKDYEKTLKPVKILVLAFPRSGSSLIGSILSSKTSTAYLYEPFHHRVFKHPNGTGVDLHFVKVPEQFISNYTNGLFDCKYPELVNQKYNSKTMIGRYEGCYQSEQIVVKAIRMHSNNLLPWIIDTDIKIVQLVRDPRAILNSQFKAKQMFGEWTFHIESLCEMMSNDAKLADILPSNRYAQLIYEDLIKQPIKTLSKMYQKFELPIDTWSIKAALRHLGEVPSQFVNGTDSYMSLYRGPQHDMNAWEYNMNKNDLIDIEEKCEKTLKEFGYMMP